MRKILVFAVIILSLGEVFSQNLSQRAISARMKTFARPEYLVKDIKYYTDTMTVISLSEYVIYPLGKHSKIESYVHRSGIDWYRESGYQNFFDTTWTPLLPSTPTRWRWWTAISPTPT